MKKVTATDGIGLAVYESGPDDAPVLVCIHGYPDNHSVWDSVIAELGDRFRVVTYDVRGCGNSDVPVSVEAYRISQLNRDLAAVIDAVSPDQPVHILAHDWGSVQSWSALTPNKLGRRIASFTSISGPWLDCASLWVSGHGVQRYIRPMLKQVRESLYIGFFVTPGVSHMLARFGVIQRIAAKSGGKLKERSKKDVVNGLNLYRANIRRHLFAPRPRTIELPVQVLAPTEDTYVSVVLQAQSLLPYVPNLHFRDIPGRHWVITQYPAIVATLVTEFVEKVEAKTQG